MRFDDVRRRMQAPALAHAAALLLAVALSGPTAPLGNGFPAATRVESPVSAATRLPDPAPSAAGRPPGAPDTAGAGGIPTGSGPPGPASPQGAFEPPWSWPLEPEPRVTRYFLPPPEPWKAGHRGVDLAAGTGGDILSPADGVVTFVGMVAGRPVLSIGHGGGLLSSFEPVSSTLPKGARVRRDQAVGTIAGPPHCPFSCLHWGVRLNGAYVNPLAYVTDRRPSVLLPLPDRDEGPSGGSLPAGHPAVRQGGGRWGRGGLDGGRRAQLAAGG